MNPAAGSATSGVPASAPTRRARPTHGNLDAQCGGHDRSSLQLVPEPSGALPKAARFGVLRGRLVVKVLGDALQLHAVRLGQPLLPA